VVVVTGSTSCCEVLDPIVVVALVAFGNESYIGSCRYAMNDSFYRESVFDCSREGKKETGGKHSSNFVEFFDGSMVVNSRGRGIHSRNQFPLLDGVEIVLILDYNELVLVSLFLQSFQVFIRNIIQVNSGGYCAYLALFVRGMFERGDNHFALLDS
jgi:hypothetical protein